MGVAAYNRSSNVISERIEHEFMEDKGNRRKRIREQMIRAEKMVQELEVFCREAQDLYRESIDPDVRNGLLGSNIEHFWKKKKGYKKFHSMKNECLNAHVNWVNSDHNNIFFHLATCRRKAKAWVTLLEYLNNTYKWPFKMPVNL